MTSNSLDEAAYNRHVELILTAEEEGKAQNDITNGKEEAQLDKVSTNASVSHAGDAIQQNPKLGFLTLDVESFAPLSAVLPQSLLAHAAGFPRSFSDPVVRHAQDYPSSSGAALEGGNATGIVETGATSKRTSSGLRGRSKSVPSTSVGDQAPASKANTVSAAANTTGTNAPSLPAPIASDTPLLSLPSPSSLPIAPPSASSLNTSESQRDPSLPDQPADTSTSTPDKRPPSIDTSINIDKDLPNTAQGPLSAGPTLGQGQNHDRLHDVATVQQEIMSRPSLNLERSPYSHNEQMGDDSSEPDEVSSKDGSKPSFWSGFRRSVSSNIAKLRTSKSTADFAKYAAEIRLGSDYHASHDGSAPEKDLLSEKREGFDRSTSDNSMPSHANFKPLPQLPSIAGSSAGIASIPPASSNMSGRFGGRPSHAAETTSMPPLPTSERRRSRSRSHSAAASTTSPSSSPTSAEPLSSHFSRVHPANYMEADNVERIAQAIRKHREANVDKVTGSMSIPRRSSSYIVSGNTLTRKTPDGSGNAGKEGDMSKIRSDGVGESDTSPLNSIDTVTQRNLEHAPAGANNISPQAVPASTSNDEELSKRPLGSQLIITQHPDDEHVVDLQHDVPGESDAETDAHVTSTLMVDSPEGQTSTELMHSKAYKQMDPATVGRLLYEEALPDIPVDKVCETIGKADDFHRAIRDSYMSCFDFTGGDVDEGFRMLAARLLIAGDSQAIERITGAYAQRFWDCNPQARRIYLEKELVENVMLASVMLNTDLHKANVGARSSQKITKKQWVDRAVEGMKDHVQKHPSLLAEYGHQNLKSWQRSAEIILRSIFDRISKRPLPQREVPKPSSEVVLTEQMLSSPEEDALNSPTSPNLGRLRRDESSLSLASNLSTGTMFSISDKRRGTLSSFSFRRKGDRTDVRHIFGEKLGPQTRSLDSQLNLATGTASSNSPYMPRHSMASTATQARHSTSNWESSAIPLQGADVLLEGQMIRKHMKNKDDVKAKHRKWMKFHCLLQLDMHASHNGTLELVMYKYERNTEIDNAGFVPQDADDVLPLRRVATAESAGTASGWTGSTEERQRSSSEAVQRSAARLSNQAPQIFNVLHALATPLPPPGYSAQRPHVFTLRLYDGQIYLFHCINAETIGEWVKTINWWAARKSKEPFPGSGGNAEFGWGPILRERNRQREQEQPERDVGEQVRSSSSESTSPPKASPTRGQRKYAASVRSFTSTGSVESGRSAVTVSGAFGDVGGRGHVLSPGGKELEKTLKKMKITEWMPPVPLGKVMSTLDEAGQLEVWKRQQQIANSEMEEHATYRDPMDKLYAPFPALRQKAAANWMRRQRWLVREMEKYFVYADLMQEILMRKSTSSENASSDMPNASPGKRRASVGSATSRTADSNNDLGQGQLENSRGKSLEIIREAGADDGGVLSEMKPRPRRHSLGRLIDISTKDVRTAQIPLSWNRDSVKEGERREEVLSPVNETGFTPVVESRSKPWEPAGGLGRDTPRESVESWRTALSGDGFLE